MDFEVMFVHFSSPDLRGHKYGWMSAAQLQAIREADAGLGKILTGLDETAFRSSTLIIVTADHGGHDKDHDGSLQVDYDVPWVLSGPGVLPMELTAPVSITDTAATAAYALGLTIPAEWDGSPVYEAFGLPLQERSPDVCK
jgi:arylsulfatase A-like enzyme